MHLGAGCAAKPIRAWMRMACEAADRRSIVLPAKRASRRKPVFGWSAVHFLTGICFAPVGRRKESSGSAVESFMDSSTKLDLMS